MTRDEARKLFPSRIRRAIALRGMTQAHLAGLLGVRDSTISEWCRGMRFPSMEQAAGLVEHLHMDALAELLTAGHTVACVVCGRLVVQTKRTRHPRYCSAGCKATNHHREQRGSRAAEGVIAKRRLTMYQEAVVEMCRSCCPDGTCDQPDCALRSVSPLPLAKVRAA